MSSSDTAPPDREEQLSRLQSVTDVELAQLTLERLLEELVDRVRDLLRADTAAVLLLDADRRELVAVAAKGIEEEVEQGVRLPVGAGFAGKIAATAKPVILDEVDHSKVLNPLLLRRGIRSMLGVPLMLGGRVIGVMHVGTLTKRIFTAEDTELLHLVADRAALAVNARREQDNRVIAETLQRSLLPDRLPHIDGVEIAALYMPAEGQMVGGDWYDVFTVPSGKLCVVVGDTVGRGLTAAISMARLRDAVRALAIVYEKPSETVEHVNDLIHHFDPDVMATLLVGFIDHDANMTFASAGHMPPVVVHEGVSQPVRAPAQPALGAVRGQVYHDHTVSLSPPSALLLYTDGLVERRGRPLDEGIGSLCRAAQRPWMTLEELCARTLGTDVLESELQDDLAVLSLRFGVDDHPAFRKILRADPRELAGLRQALRRWLASRRAEGEDVQDVLVAVGEAAANSIEHAYGPGRGSVVVQAELGEGVLDVRVIDTGGWREPRGTDRGRGRSLMSATMDHVEFERTPEGTTVRMRKRLEGARDQ